jgi:hypothetical protein
MCLLEAIDMGGYVHTAAHSGMTKGNEMNQLFTRSGTEYTGEIKTNAKGKPTYTYKVSCNRCCEVNGQRMWIMGMENGRPYSHTGFDCWACHNTGFTSVKTAPLYTAEQLAKLNAAADKRNAAKAAKQAEILAQHKVAQNAFVELHKPFFDALDTLGGEFWIRFRNDMLNRMTAPTERQVALVQGEVAKRQQNANSVHFGAIGDRVEIQGMIERVISIDTNFGIKYINVIRCNNGNLAVYRGNYLGDKADAVHLMATVIEHGERDGVKQTIIQRPKKV